MVFLLYTEREKWEKETDKIDNKKIYKKIIGRNNILINAKVTSHEEAYKIHKKLHV